VTDATPYKDLGPRTSLRRPLTAGTLVACAFFAGFGGWAATAQLAGAVTAPAIVAPEGSRKTVQHLEGGIIQRILVQDGSRVAVGQPLLELDDTRASAEHAAPLAEWRALKASEARLMAEQTGQAPPLFPQGGKVSTYVREDNGLLCDRIADLQNAGPGPDEFLDLLEADVAAGVRDQLAQRPSGDREIVHARYLTML
jgi:multidrug efflux pump subunit AcrA (membrane-fusion protein)